MVEWLVYGASLCCKALAAMPAILLLCRVAFGKGFSKVPYFWSLSYCLREANGKMVVPKPPNGAL